MKKIFIQFTIALLFPITILSAQTTPEQDAIRKVIEDETRAIQLCDLNRWADHWWHEPYCYFSITNPDQHIGLQGWEEISAWAKKVTTNCNPADQHTRKYDYRFAVNGNMAFVTFLEDQGNESTRVLEKRDGRWKLVRMGVINTIAYGSKERLNQLHRLAGNWTADMSTLKFDPPLQGWKVLDFHFDNMPTESGIRLTLWWNWKNDAGFSGKFTRRMEFATVAGSPELEMFAVESSSDGWSGASHGTAKLNADGALTMLPKKPNSDKLDETAWLTLKPDGRLQMKLENYGDDGKVDFGFSVELVKQ